MKRLQKNTAKSSNFLFLKRKKKSDCKLLSEADKLSLMFTSIHSVKKQVAKTYMNLFKHLYKYKGRKGLCSMMKQYKLQVNQIVLKQNITPIPFTKCKRDGISLRIKEIINLLDLSNINHTRCLISLFRIVELVTLDPEYNYSTITDDLDDKSKKYVAETLPQFKEFLKGWKPLKLIPNLKFAAYPLKNATGPNTSKELPYGASVLFHYDHKAVVDQAFYESIKNRLSKSDVDLSTYPMKSGNYEHSRIVSLRDKAGKERIIAIGDVLSNWALAPLEVSFQVALSKMDTSVAYKTTVVPDLIKGLGPNLFSADLSAFTDRFPRELQKAVVESRFGCQVANDWETILTKRSFRSKKGRIEYKVGNPMGFLSSWSVSTMTHHAFIEFLAHKEHIHHVSSKYIMLGDDIVVSDEYLYKFYLQGIQNLGLSISLSKCTQSKDGYTEFAKRLFTPQGEVTGFPIALTLQGLKSPVQFIGLVKVLRERGYDFSKITTWNFENLLHLCSRRTQQSFAFARELPLNYFNLPEEIWVGDVSPNMELSELTTRRDTIVAKEIQKIKTQKSEYDSLEGPDGELIMSQNHPLMVSIVRQMRSQFRQVFMLNPRGYEIWDKWLEGEMRISIPSPLPQVKNKSKESRILSLNFALKAIKPEEFVGPESKLANWDMIRSCFPGI